ncbi:hypothetical protein [Mycolicibacterium fluoranthenivorans]|uniref:Lipoprotein n=1 Tax=Mycolicibacterium fluoranthenivorans TaxID=258505 RepID=A0A1G4W1K0_9MYCO|nr:hypothetical protein [Mycolicibacterium fluoranthenivorans]SCX15267.1 hypothetical protein SAMN02799620_02026 [Mycolicibacterium fluoranthenivorans]
MNKKLFLALVTMSLLFAGCADLTESEQFGVDTVGKSAQARIKEDRSLKAQDVCEAEVAALPKDQLAKYNRDEVVKGCVRANTGGDE